MERLSPWDLDLPQPGREPSHPGGSLPVLASELEAILQPPADPQDWGVGDSSEACPIIANHIAQKFNCMEKFGDLEDIYLSQTSSPSAVQISCQSDEIIKFKIPPSPNKQLAILIPQNNTGFINYAIVDENEVLSQLSTFPQDNYTLFTTSLSKLGLPSDWARGPNITLWNHTDNYHVKVNEPKFQYKSGTYVIEAYFTWEFSGDLLPCSEIVITNTCNNLAANKMRTIYISAEKDTSVVLKDLPIDDTCQFTVHGNVDYKLDYKTPSCDKLEGCIPLPEKARAIRLDAIQSDSRVGWTVTTTWAIPKRQPISYNVTLRAKDLYTVMVPGNTTEVIFEDVEGEGIYNVSLVSIYDNGEATMVAINTFPEIIEFRAEAALMVGAWILALIFLSMLAGGVLWWKKRSGYQLSDIDFEAVVEKLGSRAEWAFPSCAEEAEDACADAWEVRAERLRLHEVVGEGAFGVVRRGTLRPAGAVAVKMLKDFPTSEEIRSFRAEMELMKSVGAHPHVVSLVGCCSGRRPLIIAEYCSRGDLLSFLRCSWDVMVSKRNAKYYNNNVDYSEYRNDLFKSKQKEDSKLVVNKMYDIEGTCDAELTILDLLSFCRQIAMGMEFLASNRVVHRDLACRNVLVTGDRTLKIADFGLSRDVYQDNQYKQKGNGKMPVKWMALESLTHRIYTTQSDVWSFGVVVWEIVTIGGSPYAEVPASRLPRLLRDGYRMSKPNNCSKQLYDIMLSCWRARPRDRPTFSEHHSLLDDLLNSACVDDYLSLELEADDATPQPKQSRYITIIERYIRGNRVCARESCERPLKALQSNHYTSPPENLIKPQVV